MIKTFGLCEMKKASKLIGLTTISFALALQAWGANGNKVDISTATGKRCFVANGIPDHPTGKFPNRGNPNAIREQDLNICFTMKPKRGTVPKPITGIMGIAINGVPFRPNTAGFWDPSARQGHSRRGNKNWSLEIFGAPGRLGLDLHNAHVGKGGMYHYHGIAQSLTRTSGTSLIGYAGDGFEIHYRPSEKKSGWRLRNGIRPIGGPPGTYDGLYNEDYEYFGGEDALDRCNGGYIGGDYAYFITDSYPFLPRCLYGEISSDFYKRGHR